ncbi:MAG: HD domain-containing protein [Sphaerochaetaceae bacterium]
METTERTGHTCQDAQFEIAFLSSGFNGSIRDPLWKDIPLSAGFKALYHCPAMQKLGRIKQLGPAFHLYPGAVHTRLSHSLGVFHIARLILLSLLRTWIDEGTPIPLTHMGMQSFLSAAMLHDLGHFPYAHALKELPLREHEQLAADLIMDNPHMQDILRDDIGACVQWVCAIIDTGIVCDNPEITFYRALLSGTLDPDKLDYLSRDAFFCGIPYGMQDASYIINRLAYIDPGLPAIPVSAIGAVEHLLFSKYLMYQNVYWHRTTRAATAMIKKALYLALMDQVITKQALYGLDDESFFQLPQQYPHFAPFALLEQVRDNQLFTTHMQIAFNGSRSLQDHCCHLERRLETEEALFNMLHLQYPAMQRHEIIIDVPENISFESDIPIMLPNGATAPFNTIDELFTKPVVEAFTSSLRKIRIFGPRSLDSREVQRVFNQVVGTIDDPTAT